MTEYEFPFLDENGADGDNGRLNGGESLDLENDRRMNSVDMYRDVDEHDFENGEELDFLDGEDVATVNGGDFVFPSGKYRDWAIYMFALLSERRFWIKFIMLTLLLCISLMCSIVTYYSFYYLHVPKVHHSLPVHFDYESPSDKPEATVYLVDKNAGPHPSVSLMAILMTFILGLLCVDPFTAAALFIFFKIGTSRLSKWI